MFRCIYKLSVIVLITGGFALSAMIVSLKPGITLHAFSPIQSALAADEGSEGGKGAGYKGPRDMGRQGSERPTGQVPGQGQGQGGPGADSDAKGPRYGGGGSSPEPGERGGKPVWAQEGIPEGDLGRLNVARSPDQVLQRSLDETINTWNPEMEAFYEMTAEDAAALLISDYDNVAKFDSPLANLAFYQDILADGVTQLPNVEPASTLDLAAILLGVAADKTIPVTENTVIAVSTLMDVSLNDADIVTLAEKAEAVRAAVLEGHGE